MRLPLNSNAPSSGSDLRATGGIESFGPPCGPTPLLAQLISANEAINMYSIRFIPSVLIRILVPIATR